MTSPSRLCCPLAAFGAVAFNAGATGEVFAFLPHHHDGHFGFGYGFLHGALAIKYPPPVFLVHCLHHKYTFM